MVKIIINDKNGKCLTLLGFDKKKLDIDDKEAIKDSLTASTIVSLSKNNESESDNKGLDEEQERLIKQSIGDCVDAVCSNPSEDMNEYHTFTLDTDFTLFKNDDDTLILGGEEDEPFHDDLSLGSGEGGGPQSSDVDTSPVEEEFSNFKETYWDIQYKRYNDPDGVTSFLEKEGLAEYFKANEAGTSDENDQYTEASYANGFKKLDQKMKEVQIIEALKTPIDEGFTYRVNATEPSQGATLLCNKDFGEFEIDNKYESHRDAIKLVKMRSRVSFFLENNKAPYHMHVGKNRIEDAKLMVQCIKEMGQTVNCTFEPDVSLANQKRVQEAEITEKQSEQTDLLITLGYSSEAQSPIEILNDARKDINAKAEDIPHPRMWGLLGRSELNPTTTHHLLKAACLLNAARLLKAHDNSGGSHHNTLMESKNVTAVESAVLKSPQAPTIPHGPVQSSSI